MSMTLDDLVRDCRAALLADDGPDGRREVCALIRKALADSDFVATHITEGTPERHVLYEDPDLGFTILAHVYTGPKTSGPHDHGPSWAIYGQAGGETIMTDWELVSRPTETAPGKARRLHDYALKPGDAYLYEPGVLHSPRRDGPTRLLRVEGINMDRVKRRPYEAVSAAA